MKSARGISLIEIALLMMFVSLAIIPMVKVIGGTNSVSGTGNAARSGSATRIIGMKSKEIVFANAMIERALAGEWNIFNTTNQGNACAQDASSTVAGIPATNSGGISVFDCIDQSYSDPIYYQWIVQDRSNEFKGNNPADPVNGDVMGNSFYQATLNVYNNDTWTQPILTMPTIAFHNNKSQTIPNTQAGVVIVLDVSGSMAWAQSVNPTTFQGTWYRYTDPNYPGYIPPTPGLNLYNNPDLDIVSAANSDDPTTPYDERYPLPVATALANGELSTLGVTSCDNADPIFSGLADGWTDNICNRNPGGYKTQTPDQNNTMLNTSMSRIEAARSSLMEFLLTIEQDPTLYQNMSLGFVLFGRNSAAVNMVPTDPAGALEKASTANQYVQMRRTISWINRYGIGGEDSPWIDAYGDTPTYAGVSTARDLLNAQVGLTQKMIFLVTDGSPTAGPCATQHGDPMSAHPNESVNSGRCFKRRLGDPLKAQGITVYALGLMQDPTLMGNVLKVGFTDPTGGTYAAATSIGQMGPLFSDVKYQILRRVIISRANRYGIVYP